MAILRPPLPVPKRRSLANVGPRNVSPMRQAYGQVALQRTLADIAGPQSLSLLGTIHFLRFGSHTSAVFSVLCFDCSEMPSVVVK